MSDQGFHMNEEQAKDIKALVPLKPKLNAKMRKAQAKAMFISGQNPKEIAEALGMNSPESISNWARQEDWYALRQVTLESATNSKLQELLASQEKTIGELDIIKKKAYESINNGNTAPQRFSEATNAYIAALEMERRLKMEALQLNFINEVGNILREEIVDPLPPAKTLLIQIARRFRSLFDRYQTSNKPVKKPTEESNGEGD